MTTTKPRKPGAGPIKRRRRQRRAIDTREKLVAAALVEFAVRGFSATSTRSVAMAAGVQHPLVTYHFKNKEGLWRAVLESTVGNFMTQFNGRLSDLKAVDDITKLRVVQEGFIRFAAENPHFHLIMSQEAQRSSQHLTWLIDEYVKPYFQQVTRLIRSAQQSGQYIQGDPSHLQYLFIGAATRIFTLAAEVEVISKRSPFSPAMIDRHVQSCLALFFNHAAGPRDSSVKSRQTKPSRARLVKTNRSIK